MLLVSDLRSGREEVDAQVRLGHGQLNDHDSWCELPAEGPRLICLREHTNKRRSGPFSLNGYFMERSSPSRLLFVAQNQRGLDRSGPFRTTCSTMREKGVDGPGPLDRRPVVGDH